MNTTKDLLLLHGALGSQHQFGPLIEKLKADFNLFTYDLPGHGGNAIPDAFSISLFEKNLLAFLDAHQLNHVSVFGYSMGGYIALQTAKNNPGRIAKIMTLGTMLKWNPEIAASEVRMLDPDIIELKVPKFARQLEERHQPQDWKLVMKKIVEMMIDMGNGSAMTAADFEKIKIPVLAGLGSQDQMVKREDAMEMANYMLNAKFQLFEGWKHPIEGVDVEELGRFIRGYFSGSNGWPL